MDGAPGEPDELAHRGEDDAFTPQRRRWIRPVAWVAVAAVVLGGGFSSALALLGAGAGAGGRGPDRAAAVVSDPIEERGLGAGTVAIETAPEGATGLAVRFTCLSAGEFSWGIDPVENPTSSCSEAGVGSEVWNEFDLPAAPRLYISADQDARWEVLVVYVRRTAAEGV